MSELPEILFRAKSIDNDNNGKWLYGDYMRYAGGAQIWTHDADGGTWNAIVDPDTVGQYTGLTDKNGAKIFEGDIVHVHDTMLQCTKPYHEFAGYVYFANASFCIVDKDDSTYHYRWADYEIEVIGNIHDNPELIVGGDCK